ncbi:MAG TPA: DUF302 domain-containing protein [Steroidobacteraceae bacterium]|nr:DUF302 domain-containing protein [Steroidobacteraceae bacterium]
MSNSTASTAGVVRIASAHSVPQTAARLEALLQERGVLIFARIDFSADAARAGLELRPEQLLIFGNPRAGTPLMQAEAVAGLDLPLKALIYEDGAGTAWIAWNDPAYIVGRHALPAALAANLAAVTPLIERAAQPNAG